MGEVVVGEVVEVLGFVVGDFSAVTDSYRMSESSSSDVLKYSSSLGSISLMPVCQRRLPLSCARFGVCDWSSAVRVEGIVES